LSAGAASENGLLGAGGATGAANGLGDDDSGAPNAPPLPKGGANGLPPPPGAANGLAPAAGGASGDVDDGEGISDDSDGIIDDDVGVSDDGIAGDGIVDDGIAGAGATVFRTTFCSPQRGHWARTPRSPMSASSIVNATPHFSQSIRMRRR
jgi:hypothetical protein